MPKMTHDFTGMEHGLWRIIEIDETRKDRDGSYMWKAECCCGQTGILSSRNISRNLSRQGCENCAGKGARGVKQIKEYNSWRAMRERCYNKNSQAIKISCSRRKYLSVNVAI